MRSRGLAIAAGAVIVFLYLPIAIIVLYAFNADRAQTWPIDNYTTHWFADAFANGSVRQALVLSLQAAFGATALALLLGSMAALAVHRLRFFGREAISFVLVLPLAAAFATVPVLVMAVYLLIARRLGAFDAL